MTTESALWHVVRRNLAPYGRLQRIESHLTATGIPDVAYCLLGSAGWLELKHVSAWPKRPTTPLYIKHLKLEQVLFLEDWTRHPSRGHAYALLQVDYDYLLLTPPLVRRLFDRVATRADLTQGAIVHAAGAFPTLAMVKILVKPVVTRIANQLTL